MSQNYSLALHVGRVHDILVDRLDVSIQIALLGESLLANVAAVGFFTSVDQQVSFQRTNVEAPQAAQVALLLLRIPGVHIHS